MNGKNAIFLASKRVRSGLGGWCLMFCMVLAATISMLAQQDEASASLDQSEGALSKSSTAQPVDTSPKISPSTASALQSLATVRATHQAYTYTPMTREERWQDYEHVNFDSYGAFFQAFFTGLGDYSGDVPHWDSGMAGLSEHVGSEFATFAIAGTIHSSLAAALHQDTRYFHCACQGGLRRTLHAVGRTFFTYGDNGHLYPDVSGLAGIYGGEMLTTEWYPAEYTATGYGVRQANIAVGVTSAIYVIREFSPEMKRAFRRRKADKGTPER